MSIKGIIFDFDGVLCNSEFLHKEAFKLALNSLGYSWCFNKEKVYEKIKLKKTLYKLKVLSRLHLINVCDIFTLNVAKQYFTLSLISNQKIDEKIFNILHNLKKRYKIAIVSDANKETIFSFLKINSIENFFDIVATSCDVSGKTKPSPRVYQYAISKLDINPNLLVAFEDSSKGMNAAKSAGIEKVILCNPGNLFNFLINL